MTTITNTLGKLLNTVGTTAEAASKIITSTTSGLDMLDVFVRTAKEKQEARTAVDMESFYFDLHNEAALENAMKAETLEKELQSNPVLKKHFDHAHSNLKSIIEQVQAKYKA